MKRSGSRQWVGVGGIVLLVLMGMAYVGARSAKPPVKISMAGPKESPLAEVPRLPLASEVVVHVAGAVKVPGLLHLPNGTRVGDAIKRAGGAKANADLDQLNLAAKVIDGSQVFVPSRASVTLAGSSGNAKRSESIPRPIQTNPEYLAGPLKRDEAYLPVKPIRPPATTVGKATEASPNSVISLNSATQSELESLPGIGPATARKIIEFRQQQGKFTSIEQLEEVKGIGPKKMEAIRSLIRL